MKPVFLSASTTGHYIRKSVYGTSKRDVMEKVAAVRLRHDAKPKRQGTIAELLERWLVEKVEPRRRPFDFSPV